MIDNVLQVTCINGIFIYLIVCIPVEAKSCSLDAGINGSLIIGECKYFKSTLFCGVWWHFLCQSKSQAAETPTCLSFFKVKMQSPKEIEEVTNLIASALYRDRTDLILILAFSNIQLQSWYINPKCIHTLDKHHTFHYLYFPGVNIRGMLNFVRVWCNTRR